MSEDLGERTEDATPKRRQEAREEGNIARSQDASNALLLFGAILLLASGIKPLLLALASMLEKSLAADYLEGGVRPDQVTAMILPPLMAGA